MIACKLATLGACVGWEELLSAVGLWEGVRIVDCVCGWRGAVSEAVPGVALEGRAIIFRGGGIIDDDFVAVGYTAAG